MSLTRAFMTFIPKDVTEAGLAPTALRPINVLSAIYRLWTKARFEDAMIWQDKWVPPRVGRRRHRGAEGLFVAVVVDLEMAGPCNHVARVSYDFAKSFDCIPHKLMLAVLRKRGMSKLVLRRLGSMYATLHRGFNLQG